MDITKRIDLLCSVNKVMSTDFAAFVNDELSQLDVQIPSNLSVNEILKKIEENKYATVEDIESDIETFESEILEKIKNNDFGIAIHQLLSDIKNAVNQKEKKVEEGYKDLFDISEELAEFVEEIPSDYFAACVNVTKVRTRNSSSSKHEKHEKHNVYSAETQEDLEPPPAKINVEIGDQSSMTNSMKEMLMALKERLDNLESKRDYNMVKLIVKGEPTVSEASDIDINLEKLPGRSIAMLRTYFKV